MYVDTKICLTATLSLALRAFCVNRFAALASTFQAFSLNTFVGKKVHILFLTLLSSVAFASDPHIDSVVLPPTIPSQLPYEYVPPQDVRHTFELSPLYQLEQDRTPLRDDQFIGVDWYSTGEPILPEFEFKQPPSRGHVTIYYLLQALDIYTTYYATTRYSCVTEQNPLLPLKPSVEEMMLLKLLPLYALHDTTTVVSDEELAQATALMTVVVVNNVDVIQRAKKMCP